MKQDGLKDAELREARGHLYMLDLHLHKINDCINISAATLIGFLAVFSMLWIFGELYKLKVAAPIGVAVLGWFVVGGISARAKVSASFRAMVKSGIKLQNVGVELGMTPRRGLNGAPSLREIKPDDDRNEAPINFYTVTQKSIINACRAAD